ncbi:DUF7282 domain-containing protein [Natrialba sp. SSL1]|uniref:DUF7282 domain-containing protein n=1 Tax=Natrialba sp. SSL1 TaxID=1869245 RepID=UPI0008F83587|nr:hypothetical protein [Natrialba sp. SSL1]OIB58470.1 hypothetical protein BBD46_09125 [Natrialba sp. SSL1]
MHETNSDTETSDKVLRRTVIKLTAAGGATAAMGAGTAAQEDDEDEDVDDDEIPVAEDAQGEEIEEEAVDETQAEIVFPEQTTDGTSLEIESATLPRGGFISIQDPTLAVRNFEEQVEGDERWFDLTVLGHSPRLDAGSYDEFTIELEEALEESRSYLVMLHRDTTGSGTFDWVASQGAVDEAYLSGGERVRNRVVGDAYLEIE